MLGTKYKKGRSGDLSFTAIGLFRFKWLKCLSIFTCSIYIGQGIIYNKANGLYRITVAQYS